jgi:Holliday junction DNA helicase RuvA
MIARIEGTIVEHDGPMVVVDCMGVGYGVVVCPDEQGGMHVGDKHTLYIAENIKEDSFDLYGFRTKTRKELYIQLTSVNGVGPKAGMAILSVGYEDEIRKAIAEGDTAFLARANGVGKKVAERVVVDLKSKVGMIASADATDFLRDDTISDNDEAVQALTALGYSIIDAKFALSTIDRDLPLEQRIKQALKG